MSVTHVQKTIVLWETVHCEEPLVKISVIDGQMSLPSDVIRMISHLPLPNTGHYSHAPKWLIPKLHQFPSISCKVVWALQPCFKVINASLHLSNMLEVSFSANQYVTWQAISGTQFRKSVSVSCNSCQGDVCHVRILQDIMWLLSCLSLW